MRFTTAALALLVLSLSHVSHAADAPALPVVTKVEQQPLVSQVERLVDSLEFLGTPLSKPDRDALKAAMTDIGANEYIVDITHNVPGPDGKPVPAIDFISTMDTNRQQEFNMWYHTLNCGFRVRASGETDFPCISGQRVGMGRVYVNANGRLNYEDWCEGIREGRSYVSDGTSHLMEFAVHPAANAKQIVPVGYHGSELKLDKPTTVHLSAKVATRLDGKQVPIEVIVNGYPVKKLDIVADGTTQDVSFDVPIERSSWVALRLFPNAHTNPVFVLIGDKPIRASRRSAEWCLRGVDQCWEQKQQFYAAAEKDEAAKAYEHARVNYRQIVSASEID